MVNANHLSDAKATEVLQRLDAAEPRHRVEELHRSGGQAWGAHTQHIHAYIHGYQRPDQLVCASAMTWSSEVVLTRYS